MRKLTRKDVVAFWKYMSREYGFKVMDKGDSVGMKFVGELLEKIGIQDKKDFMERYSTTIGDLVYVPFEIGKGGYGDWLNQVMTCVHEAQHVVQYKRDEVGFVSGYVFSSATRAHYEMDAYRTNLEMYWFLTGGKMLSAKAVAGLLRGYGVKAVDMRVVEKHLVVASKVVREGMVVSGTSKVAQKWLRKRLAD